MSQFKDLQVGGHSRSLSHLWWGLGWCLCICLFVLFKGFPVALVVKNPPANAGDWVRKILCTRAGKPTSICLPGESCGQSSLVCYSPWGRKELDMTGET